MATISGIREAVTARALAQQLDRYLWLLFLLPLSFVVLQITLPGIQGRWFVLIDVMVFSICAIVFLYNMARSRGPLRWSIGFGAVSMIISLFIQVLGFLVNINVYSYSDVAPFQELLIYAAYILGFLALALYFPIENFRFGGLWQVILSGAVVGLSFSAALNAIFGNIERILQYIFPMWSSTNETYGMIVFIALDIGVAFSLSLLAMRLGYRLPVLIFLFLSMLCLVIGDIAYWFCTGLFTPEVANQIALPMYMARRIIWAIGVNYHVMRSPDLKYNIKSDDLSLGESVMWIVVPVVSAFSAFLAQSLGDGNFDVLLVGLIAVSAIHLAFVIIDYQRVYRNLRVAQLNTARVNAELLSANVELQRRQQIEADLAAERARTGMARDIHDSLGGHLHAATSLASVLVEQDGLPPRLQRALGLLHTSVADAHREMRRAITVLKPDAPDDGPQPLEAALAGPVEDARRYGLPVALEVQGEARPVPAGTAAELVQVVREALTNAHKYAQATEVRVVLDWTDPVALALTIADNGIGMQTPSGPRAAGTGNGMANMRARVEALGGTLEWPPVERGVTLWIRIPQG